MCIRNLISFKVNIYDLYKHSHVRYICVVCCFRIKRTYFLLQSQRRSTKKNRRPQPLAKHEGRSVQFSAIFFYHLLNWQVIEMDKINRGRQPHRVVCGMVNVGGRYNGFEWRERLFSLKRSNIITIHNHHDHRHNKIALVSGRLWWKLWV